MISSPESKTLPMVKVAPVATVESTWDPDKSLASIESVHHDARRFASQAFEWYCARSKSSARASQVCRAFSVALISIGGLMPILGSVGVMSERLHGFFEWSYLLLAVGASFIAVDRFFGFSSARTRYVLAAEVIKRSAYAFELEWIKIRAHLGSRAPRQSDIEEFLGAATTLYGVILGEVTQETRRWAEEYQQSILDLASIAKLRGQRNEPDNAAAFERDL